MAGDINNKIDKHFSKFPARTYPKGQIVIYGGEDPEHVFYIASGKVRQYDISYRGDEIIVNIFKPPAFFPMSWAINKTPNKYFFKTETDTTVHIVPADDAVKFIKDNPDVMLDLLGRLYLGVDGILGRLVGLMAGNAKSRLIYELVTECQRFGKQLPDGSIAISVNEADLAARSGLTRETISREMHKLKAQDLLRLNPKSIRVKNLAELEAKLGTEI